MKAPAAVFLDRDGTIMEDKHFIKNPDDVRLLPGAAEAIAELNRRMVPVIVVTNQSGIARGLLTVADYEAVRDRLAQMLRERGARIDASYYCPHFPAVTGPCECRKPGTKLFRDALRDFALAADTVAYVGDRWRDVAASVELGGRGVLIQSEMTSAHDRRRAEEAGIEKADSLQDAIKKLFSLTEPPDEK